DYYCCSYTISRTFVF
nr:immunoglobulin light chain junction region [Macaca mulatta]